MNIPFVDLKRQYASIKNDIDAAIEHIVTNTAFIGGKAVTDFTEGFAKLCGAKHCIPVGNGTDALYIALRALGIGRGHKVVVPANSFIATSEAVTMAGAQPVFCDVDPVTYNIDTTQLRTLVEASGKGGDIKAVIPVHLYGQPADMDGILAVAKDFDLKVVEDAAQGHCAEYKGRRIGSIGDAACFSFYPGKNLGAYGDAGAIVTNDDELAKRMKMTANHGRIDKYDHEFEGVNSRMDGIQGAILGAKLPHIERWSEMRRANAEKYSALFAAKPALAEFITPPSCPEGLTPVFHLYVIRAKDRDGLASYLRENGVAVGIHYPIALPDLGAYKYLGHGPKDFPVAQSYQSQILSLPMFPELTAEEIETVVTRIGQFYNV